MKGLNSLAVLAALATPQVAPLAQNQAPAPTPTKSFDGDINHTFTTANLKDLILKSIGNNTHYNGGVTNGIHLVLDGGWPPENCGQEGIISKMKAVYELNPSYNLVNDMETFLRTDSSFKGSGTNWWLNFVKNVITKLDGKIDTLKSSVTDYKDSVTSSLSTLFQDKANEFLLGTFTNSPTLNKIHEQIEGEIQNIVNSSSYKVDHLPYLNFNIQALETQIKTIFTTKLNTATHPDLLTGLSQEMLNKLKNELNSIDFLKSGVSFDNKQLEEFVTSSQNNNINKTFLDKIQEFKTKQPNISVNYAYTDTCTNPEVNTENKVKLTLTLNGASVDVVKRLPDVRVHNNFAVQKRSEIQTKINELIKEHFFTEQRIRQLENEDNQLTQLGTLIPELDAYLKTIDPNGNKLLFLPMDSGHYVDRVGTSLTAKVGFYVVDANEYTGGSDLDQKYAKAYPIVSKQVNIVDELLSDWGHLKETLTEEWQGKQTMSTDEANAYVLDSHLDETTIEKINSQILPSHTSQSFRKRWNELKAKNPDYILEAEVYSKSDSEVVFRYRLNLNGRRTDWYEQSWTIEKTNLQKIISKLKGMGVRDDNPVTPSNINGYAGTEGQNPLSTFVDGFQEIMAEAHAMPEDFTITHGTYFVEEGFLKTTLTVTSADGTKVGSFTREISHSFADQEAIDAAKDAIQEHGEAKHEIINHAEQAGDITSDQAKSQRQDIEGMINEAVKELEDGHQREQDVKEIVEKVQSEMGDLTQESLDSIKREIINNLPKNLPPELAKTLVDNIDELVEGIKNAKDPEQVRNLLTRLKNSDISTLNKMRPIGQKISLSGKIILTSLGGILGLGGVVGTIHARKLITVNKKLANIKQHNIKVKSSKKMAIISTAAAILMAGASIGIFILIFLVQGGI